MSKLCDVVKNGVVELAAKVNNIDTSDFVLKAKYQTDKTELKKKLTGLENQIPDVSSLAIKTALTAVENKMLSVSSLIKKKQTMTQKLVNLKRNLLIMIMTNI